MSRTQSDAVAENNHPGSDREAPVHAGLLREDVLALRTVLGYADSIDESTHLQAPEKPDFAVQDMLLVGIDFDTNQGYDQIAPDPQLHVGISVLDTRRLHNLTNHDLSTSDPLIRSYQFTVGDSKYCQKASEIFFFGESRPIQLSEIQEKIHEVTAERDFAYVFHGAYRDLKMFHNLGIDFAPLSGFTSTRDSASSRLLYLFDTNKVAQWPLQLSYRLSLAKLCETLGIPSGNLHAAGNDAHFALRALLMLAVKDAERLQELYDGDVSRSQALLQKLGDIAQAPRPPSRNEIEQALVERKREKDARRQARQLAKRERKREAGGQDGRG